MQFLTEVLKSLCIQEGHLSCADKFINGLLENSSNSEVQFRFLKSVFSAPSCDHSGCHGEEKK